MISIIYSYVIMCLWNANKIVFYYEKIVFYPERWKYNPIVNPSYTLWENPRVLQTAQLQACTLLIACSHFLLMWVVHPAGKEKFIKRFSRNHNQNRLRLLNV